MSVFIESSISAKQIARVMISFAWVYHGLFPKLVHIAPLEKLMTDSVGLSEQLSYLVTKTAGVCEILFGIVFFYLYIEYCTMGRYQSGQMGLAVKRQLSVEISR